MILVQPILTDHTLEHCLSFLVPLWVRVRPVACAVQPLKVLVVRVALVEGVLLGRQLAGEARELGVAAVAPEVALGVDLEHLVKL